jgi:serine/threonine protein kinase
VIGRRINNFDVTRRLGEGGMGAVYEATHSLMPRRVAVKVLRREFATDAAVVQRFFNEARATNSIRHPSIVEIVDVGMLPDGVPYLIMELLEGESLAQRLARDGRLPLPLAIDFTLQVASALHTAHQAGIVHRDLKPDHLFLVKDDRHPGRAMVKVLDFGIAKLRTDRATGNVQTNAGTILGTPAYMSPEQCRGVAEVVDHRADIYGLGITLYELICGQPPFLGRGIGDTMMMHMGMEPDAPSRRREEVPPDLDRIVLKALEKKPEDRFSTMAELAHALEQCSVLKPGLAASTPARASATPAPAAVASVSPRVAPSRRTSLIALSGIAGVALLGHALLRSRGDNSMAAKEVNPTEQEAQSLRPPLPIAPPVAPAAGTAAPVVGAQGSGLLSLDSVPWSNVFLGNRLLGSTPLNRVALPAGMQELRLENPELSASMQYLVQIEAGKAVSRFVDWQPQRASP